MKQCYDCSKTICSGNVSGYCRKCNLKRFPRGNRFSVGNKASLGLRHSAEWKKQISEFMKQYRQTHPNPMSSPEVVEKMRASLTGKTVSERGRLNIQRGHVRGAAHPMWKGGITPINKAIRDSIEYEEWRKKVFVRDNYTCQNCGKIGGCLHADHIKPFCLYPELRLEISNGRTLCEDCHDRVGWNYRRYLGSKVVVTNSV